MLRVFLFEWLRTLAVMVGLLVSLMAHGQPTTKTAQTITFGTAPTLTVGAVGALSATATSNLTVTFTSQSASTCTVAGNTVTGVIAGTCTVAADQGGSAAYSVAPQVLQSIPVTSAAVPSCSITPATASVVAGTGQVFTANCTNSPTNYQWSQDGSLLANSAANTFTTGTGLAVGSHTVSVTASNASGPSSPASATLTVTDVVVVPSCSVTPAMASVVAGTGQVFTANCTNSPTNYQWLLDGSQVAFGSINSYATGINLAVGSHTVTVTASNASGPGSPALATLTVTSVVASMLAVQSPSNGTVTNPLGIINCGASCVETLLAGTPVALTAIANNGYTFGGWSGYAGCSSANPCLFNMPASSVNLVANFVSSSILGTFSATGSMSTPRLGHTATLLSNGKVLIAGGDNSSNTAPRLNTAELYDPVSGTFSPTGNLTTGRGGHTATKLADGRVLLVGGVDAWQTGRWLASAEIYDPATGIFTATGSMSIKRSDHVAALLANGKVLIAGGYYSVVAGVNVYLNSAEVFDPVTGVFTPTGNMNSPRIWFSATTLSTGKVLVAGGSQQDSGTLASTELYDPATGLFTYSANLNAPRLTHFGSAMLVNNNVLFAGGQSFIGTQFLGASELYSPATGTVAAAGNMSVARVGATATLLLDGGVIVAGGYTGAVFLRSAEIFNPVSGTFSSTVGDMTSVRYAHTATRLGNGKVLFVGGQISQATVGSIASSAELYTPAPGGPSLLAVQSRKTHASAGAFDLPVDTNMLITGAVTVEPRIIGSGHNIVFQFNQPITASGAVLAVDAASVAIGATAVAAGNEVTVTLAAIPNATRVTISLTGVNGTFNTSASLGFLVGDSNSSRSVNSSDISGVKARSGQATTAANFQFDLNASGSINSSDISAVKARSGSTLP